MVFYQSFRRTLLCFLVLIFFVDCYDRRRKPTLLISIISRNDEHVLPYFLGCIEKFNYPKDRISIYIQTDHNIDSTYNVLLRWYQVVRNQYHQVLLNHVEEPFEYDDASGPNAWTHKRYRNILELRQNALNEARKQWADYVLFTDSDNFLIQPDMLENLMQEKKTIIAPMLRIFDKKSAYSNFWGGVDDQGYYRRVPEYFKILKLEDVGVFDVPMIHSTFLIDLGDPRSDNLQLSPIPATYKGDIDDLLVFAFVSKNAGLKFHVSNKLKFGYMANAATDVMSLEEKKADFKNSYVDFLAYNDPIPRSINAPIFRPDSSYHGFSEIFMINLVRRPDRYERMKIILEELGIKWRHFPAVDGRNLTTKKVEEIGVVAMKDFTDPYLKRPITFGEIGCFLSHWYIWQEMVEKNLQLVMVLEDDVRFEFDFVEKLHKMMGQAEDIKHHVDWDLIYIGRKHMSKDKEYFVEGSNMLVYAKYSYWTLGYIITLKGAQKLIAGDPLGKMVPVDEYIPIMFDDHSNAQLKEQFYPRNLVGLSAEPLLAYPTHYVGDDGYISDTEDTLSHQGEDVQHFRIALEEKKLEKEREAASMKQPKEDL